MRYIIFIALFGLTWSAQAQEMHDAFKQDAELKEAFMKLDMSIFMSEPVNFICDTIDKTVSNVTSLNNLMRQNILFPKNTQVKKASETNNGYVQTFGIYKNDDAIMYVRFTLNAETGKLEEVVVERNN